MNPFDEDDEGEISIGERSDVERDMTPDIPKAPSVKTFDDTGNFDAAGDVHRDTLRAFVACVIYANAALLLVSLGPMVWFFEGWTQIGAVLLAGGVLAGIRAYQTYRAWDRSRAERDDDAGGEPGDDHDDAGDDHDDAGDDHDDAGSEPKDDLDDPAREPAPEA